MDTSLSQGLHNSLSINNLAGATELEPDPARFSNLLMTRDFRRSPTTRDTARLTYVPSAPTGGIELGSPSKTGLAQKKGSE